MASYEHIFLRTGRPVGEVAARLAELPGMLMFRDEEDVHVSRGCADGSRIGGEVTENLFVEPDEDSVLAGYDTVWSLRTEAPQPAEADQLFMAISHTLAWPAMLVLGFDTLVAAWSPEHGLYRFPPGTTPDEQHRDRWRDYAFTPS